MGRWMVVGWLSSLITWSVRSVAKALDLSFSTVSVGLAMNDLLVAKGRDGIPLQEVEAQDAHLVLGL